MKIVGMGYIKGVNDKEYAKFLASQPKPTEQVMISIVDSRW